MHDHQLEKLKGGTKMKKIIVIMMALGLTVSLTGIATAGMGGDCGNCSKHQASSDPYRKFQADTIDLRQEMMLKRFEVQRENLKGTPDSAKIAALQADIKVLQAKILEIRTQSGLPNDKCDGECAKKQGRCDKKGMGDCNGAPCGGRK
jgi:hypothetical protein